METLRWKKEKETRFQQDRLKLYTEFYSTAFAIVATWHAEVNEEVPNFYLSKEEDLYPRLLLNLIPRLRVMAPPAVRSAANDFENEIYDAATGGYYPDDLARTLQLRLDDFVEAARKDLGVPIGAIEDGED